MITVQPLSRTSQMTADNIRGDGIVWDDLFAPFTQVKQGATLKPDWDYTNGGLLFPQNDATEVIDIILQFPHSRKAGSPIRPHLHWRQAAATAVIWKMQYKWFNNGAAVPAGWTTLTAYQNDFVYTSGSILQISDFPEIDGAALTGLSSMMIIKLYREDNTTTGDVLGYQFDVHFQRDTLDSRQEYAK